MAEIVSILDGLEIAHPVAVPPEIEYVTAPLPRPAFVNVGVTGELNVVDAAVVGLMVKPIDCVERAIAIVNEAEAV